MIVPPGETLVLTTYCNKRLPFDKKLLISEKVDPSEDIIIPNVNLAPFKVVNMVTNSSPENRYNVILENNTDHYLKISQNEPVGTITSDEKEFNFIELSNLITEIPDDDNQNDNDVECTVFNNEVEQLDRPIIIRDHLMAKSLEQLEREKNITVAKRRIDQDDSLTQAEKIQALKDFTENDYYQESVTKNIEKQGDEVTLIIRLTLSLHDT